MALVTHPGEGVGGDGRGRGALSVSETYWGYEISDREDRFDRERLAEPLLRFLGLVFVIAAYGQWFLPEILFRADSTVVKATICFLFGAAGLWLYWLGDRGLATNIEIDMSRREIRVVRRNSRGRRRTEATVPMARIESAFVQRSKDPGQQAHLFLRIRAPDAVLHVATGAEDELATLLRRLGHDIRPLRELVDARLAASLSFRSRRKA
jgi:hypothetical protein